MPLLEYFMSSTHLAILTNDEQKHFDALPAFA